jgi:glutamate racemase
MIKGDSRPIGIFDSGIGGLTVLKAIERILPHENVIYFGDTARVPYGNKSRQTVIRFSTENILFLLKKNVKIIVIACNTSSSLALEYLKKIFNIPVIGVIDPAVQRAIASSQKKRIGVIGTKSTVNSRVYQRKIMEKAKDARVFSKECPLFVPFVEEGIVRGRIIDSLIQMYLKGLKGKIDTLILGCTHYPLLKPTISKYLKGVSLVDSASAVAHQARGLLSQRNMLSNKKPSSKDFYVTDDSHTFKKLAKLFLKRDISKPKVINV